MKLKHLLVLVAGCALSCAKPPEMPQTENKEAVIIKENPEKEPQLEAILTEQPVVSTEPNVLPVPIPPPIGPVFPPVWQGKKEGGRTGNSDEKERDLCPRDPNKTKPGQCGCGVPDTDVDKDGVAACLDCDDDDADFGQFHGTKRYVDPLGSDTDNNCANKNNPCLGIDYAINQADPNDTILLSAGTFIERRIVILKPIYIYGRGPGVTIVDGLNEVGRIFRIETQGEQATLCGLTITHGFAQNSGGGGLYVLNSQANLHFIEVTENTSRANGVSFGGGISVVDDSMTLDSIVLISKSTISKNIVGNANINDAYGGGIYNSGGRVRLVDSAVSGNTANGVNNGIGGGYYSIDGSSIFNRSTISGNAAQSAGNAFGGGIYVENTGNNDNILNSTISGNTASLTASVSRGGGIYVVEPLNPRFSINNSTIALNTANDGAGIFTNTNLPVRVGETIISSNGSENCDKVIGSSNLGSQNFNLDSQTTCNLNLSNDLQNANANLQPLANNGGPTQTHALGAMSAAKDAGGATCNVIIDQRGEPRPPEISGNCDIGSFEEQAP